jgi:hypothetical protein
MNNTPDSSLPEEESNAYTFRQIMDTLLLQPELIVTVPTSQVEALKSGLVMRKSKDNRKAIRCGLLPEERILSFTDYPAVDKDTKEKIPDQTCVRVKLVDKKSVNIIAMEVPDDEF